MIEASRGTIGPRHRYPNWDTIKVYNRHFKPMVPKSQTIFSPSINPVYRERHECNINPFSNC